ncbi:hypothetical protein FB451DRAFT_1233984 [Mycena latifolia]|nr:hypothetical protein FB451DRAFT_1233984 [Mycena latifolia]
MNNAQASVAAAMAASRGSPLAPNQRVATRSPANQGQSQPPNPQMAAHPHPPPQLNFSYPTPPHLRAAANGANSSPRPLHALPTHLAQGARASPSPAPAANAPQPATEGGLSQQQQPYQMYYPANVFMQSGRAAPAGYPQWMVARGGGAPAGMQMMQPIMPGGQPHPLQQHHQVPVGGGGKGQPGLPGR